MYPLILDDNDLSFAAESEIRPSFRMIAAAAGRSSAAARILLLAFDGPYGVGSAGRRDAAFLIAMSRAATALWYADALLFDLRRLDYVWGDDICGLFDVPRLVGFMLPAAIVASRANRAPLSGIINPAIDGPAADIFLQRREAIAHLLATVRATAES